MKPASPSFLPAVNSTLASTPVSLLFENNSAIVLERVACRGGRTEWHFCRARRAFDKIETLFSPGSVVSFYFGQRIRRLSVGSGIEDSEFERIIARDREFVIGVLED